MAFQNGDVSASKEFHKLENEPHKINNLKKSFERFLEISLQGVTSGITNSIIIVAAAYGVSLGYSFDFQKLSGIVVTFGLTLLLVSGFSLAYTEFLRRKDYIDLYNREKRREKWECDNYIEGEQKEMVELYTQKGLSKADAEAVINILSKDKGFFVEVMMKEELEMIKPDERVPPFKTGALLFFSKLIFGLIPLIPFILEPYIRFGLDSQLNFHNSVCVSAFLTLMALFAAGVLKSNFTVTPWWKSGLQLVMNGLIVFAATFFLTKNMLRGIL